MKFDKYKPYFQAYQLDPQAVFFIGSQIFLKNPKFPQNTKTHLSRMLSSKTPLKGLKTPLATFNSFNNFMRNDKKPHILNKSDDKTLEKSPSNDIESLEIKGVLTWESQISEEMSETEHETSRNRVELLNTLNNLTKIQEKTPKSASTRPQISRKMSSNYQTPGGILRKKAEEKGLLTENSDKMLSFEINLIEKTPNNAKNKSPSPNKMKSKSISFSKTNNNASPLKKKKANNEELHKNARKIQKKYRDYKERQSNLTSSNISKSYKILQHYLGYSIIHFQKKIPNSFEKKQATGSLLISYIRKSGHLRINFKSIVLKRIFLHIFDFSEVNDEKLILNLFDEFLNKILPMLCIFNEQLMLRNFALSANKTLKLHINKFILEEIEIVYLQETLSKFQIPSLMKQKQSFQLKLDDLEPLFNKDENILTISSQTSLHPLINDISNKNWQDNNIFPLINQIGSLSDLSFVEPLINHGNNSNDNSQIIPMMHDEEDEKQAGFKGIESINAISQEIKSFQGFELNLQKIDENEWKPDGDNKENSEKLSQKTKKLTKIEKIIKIQSHFRGSLAKKIFTLRKIRKNLLFKRFIIAKQRDYLIDLRIFYDQDENSFIVKTYFFKKIDKSLHVFHSDKEKSSILKSILHYKEPLTWIKIDYTKFKVFFKNPEKCSNALSSFEEAFLKIPRRLLSYGWDSLVIRRNFKRTVEKTLKFENVFQKLTRNSIQKCLKFLYSWSHGNDSVVTGTKKLNIVFSSKMRKIWRLFNNKLKLSYKLSEQLNTFTSKCTLWMDKIETKRGYLTSFKRVFLFSKFKDCEFLENRMLYYKKKTIEAFCYFQPEKELLLIYTISSEIMQYDEKIDFSNELKKQGGKNSESLAKKTKIQEKTLEKTEKTQDFDEILVDLSTKMLILKKRIQNITLIQDPNSIKLRFKLYPEEYLGSSLKIQSYLYKKLYYQTFQIKDLKSGKLAKVYIVLHASKKIHLVVKNYPSLLSSIHEISNEMCFFIKMTKKIRILEVFLSEGLLYSFDKNEILFQEHKLSRVWLKKMCIIDGSLKKNLLLELDVKSHKLLIRIENEEKFYKLALPEIDFDDDTSLEAIHSFAEKTLEDTVILKEIDGKYRILNDSDNYGPLIHKEEFPEENHVSEITQKKLRGIIRLIDIKKNFLILIEVPQAYRMISLISNTYIAYENDENKRVISEYLLKGIKDNLNYDSIKGVVIKEEFIKDDLRDYLQRIKGDSPLMKHVMEKEITKNMNKNNGIINKNSKNDDDMKKKQNISKDLKNSEINEDNNNGVRKANAINDMERIDEENVVLEGDIEDYEKAALKIQSKYRSRKHPQQNTVKTQNHSKEKQVKTSEDLIKEKKTEGKKEEIVVLEGNIQEYEKAALMIQKKYRKKTPKKTKNYEKIEKNEKNKEILKKNEQYQKKEEIVLEGDIQEYEKAALMIQKKYRKKTPNKSEKNEKKIGNGEKVKNIEKNPKIKKENEEIILEGDIQDYEKAALMIQKKYRKKSPKKIETNAKNSENIKKIEKNEKNQKNQKIEENVLQDQEVILEGDIQDYEKAALMIQKKYRDKSVNKSKKTEKIVSKPNPMHIEDKNKSNKTKKIDKKEETVVLEGDIQEYEKAALMIQKKYRKKSPKKNKTKKIEENGKNGKIKENLKNTNEEVVLEGDIEDYEKAALMIQKNYRKKSPKKQKNEEKSKNNEKSDEIVKNKNIKNFENPSKNAKIKKTNDSQEKIILEGPLEDYEKAALKIQAKYRNKKSNTSSKSPKIEDSPPKPLMLYEENKNNFILDGPIEEYETAALKIQSKYRKKHNSQGKTPVKVEAKPQKSVVKKPLENFKNSSISEPNSSKIQNQSQIVSPKGCEVDIDKSLERTQKSDYSIVSNNNSMKGPRHSLAEKRKISDPVHSENLEEFEKKLTKKNSFKGSKRNSLFTRLKGRTFEVSRTGGLENFDESLIRDENYRIRVFPAPEDLEIAVTYLQEWWRAVLKSRGWGNDPDEINSFFEDIR